MTTEDLQVSWLHCNICHKAFDSHNTIKWSGDRLAVAQSNLYFYFTGCGHFFCENCLKSGQSSRCRVCGEQSQSFKLHSAVPDKVAMYMKPPIGLLEDSLSIMMFQLDNANKLINALRTKISSQKDLLLRAKQEVAQVKDLKERIKVLEKRGADVTGGFGSKPTPFNPAQSIQIDPNETFQIPSEFHQRREIERPQIPQPPPFSPYINNAASTAYNHHHNYNNSFHNKSGFIMPPESPLIHAQGRLSLKSPSLSAVMNNNANNSIIMPSPSAFQHQQYNSRNMKRPRPVTRK